ncbi:hypothetical protein [Tychonema sp. LEGE 07203]|nr:hypothetical protein [Tychonema sp. LEGE 07203]MBE9096171.1 hypothetical protein [Tychonema sp. LEGE 07203]
MSVIAFQAKDEVLSARAGHRAVGHRAEEHHRAVGHKSIPHDDLEPL